MGAYLSEPLTTKDSSEEANDFLACGSSSMQGWRISQEDAHNCILNFDDKTSFFAVYDGHGGAEVAQYCSLNLPTFLKKLQSYKNKDFEQALKDAFLGFDATLLEERVIEELKKLSDKTNGEDAIEEDDVEEEDDNVDDLCKEARMPLNEVLQMYKKDKKNPALAKIKEGSCSKPLSPYLKGKRKGLTDGDEPGPSSSSTGSSSGSAEADASNSKTSGVADAADSTVSSSSNKTEEAAQKPESSTTNKKADQSDEISDTDGVVAKKTNKEECAPDSSSAGPTVNGEVAESASKSAVSSSSVSAQENGEVSSNSAGGSSSNNKKIPLPGGSSGSNKTGTSVDSSSAGSSSSVTAAAGSKKRKAKNGGANIVNDDSEDDDTETDEEFPPVQDSNENSSTEDGEEDTYGEEASEEEEEDDEEGEGEYDEEEEDYMNEEDEAFMSNITDEPGKDSGCTAVVALLHDKELFVANAGDSRCVVCRNGKALEMSIDHKPEDQVEFERIQKAGGRVTLDGRVNGGLNLSRAIGDHGYKMNKKVQPEDQMISALPDIKKIFIEPEDEFMVLACDGIWNFMTSDDVVEFVQDRIADPTKKLTDICEEMFDYCLAPHTKGDGTGCDNMTAIIVQFKPNFTGAASRKRACSPDPESDCKKAKTETSASSTTAAGSNGSKCETTSSNDEKEAAAAVASIEPSSGAAMDTDDNTASSST